MRVSLLLTYYGNRYYQLKRSLPFLLSQTYKDYEIIFLDDGRISENDLSPTDLLDHPKVKYISLRDGVVPIRSPNNALRYGFYNSDSDLIITAHPDHLVPYYAIERMVTEGNMERRNCPTQYHLISEQVNYLYGDGLMIGWKNDFNKIKGVPNFMATTTPWGYTNYDCKGYRTHFSFSGSTRERFEKFMIPKTEEWGMEDSYVHKLEVMRGEPSVGIDIEVYHQEHERVYGTMDSNNVSVRIRKIRESKLK
jgi:hypothetical protein